jgi:hypothetical protein
MKSILFLLMLAIPINQERVVGSNVQFTINKDHKFVPVLPIEFVVDQEEGGISEGLQTCNIVTRVVGEHQSYIIFRCGDRSFKMMGITFTQSESKGRLK